jgi:hypothetical protein
MQIRPPVMLISGQLLTADTWTPQVRSLSRDYDLRFADHTRDDTIAVMAERLLAEAPGRFDIVAHAIGFRRRTRSDRTPRGLHSLSGTREVPRGD